MIILQQLGATLSNNYLYGPEDALHHFICHNISQVKEFFYKPGSIIEFDLGEIETIHNPRFKNHAVIPVSSIIEEEIDEFETEKDNIALLEHQDTGYFYLLFEDFYDGNSYGIVRVEDFQGDPENPHEISIYPKAWEKTGNRAEGTRAGGIPLNSDGSDYSGLWPHFEGEPLPFMAQFRLKTGKYVYAFVDDTKDNCYQEADGANCVISEDGLIPSWIEMKPVTSHILKYKDAGFAPNPKNASISNSPDWIQGDESSNDKDDKFLGQVGYRTIPHGDEFMFGDCGDYYIFFNKESKKGFLIAQCH